MYENEFEKAAYYELLDDLKKELQIYKDENIKYHKLLVQKVLYRRFVRNNTMPDYDEKIKEIDSKIKDIDEEDINYKIYDTEEMIKTLEDIIKNKETVV